MLGREAIVGHEGFGARAPGDVADEMPERLRRAPVEPATMQMQDGRAGKRSGRTAAPSGDAAHRIGLVAHAFGSGDAAHERIERLARGGALQRALVRLGQRRHGRRDDGVLVAQRVDGGKGGCGHDGDELVDFVLSAAKTKAAVKRRRAP